jgi:hypothetical protein
MMFFTLLIFYFDFVIESETSIFIREKGAWVYSIRGTISVMTVGCLLLAINISSAAAGIASCLNLSSASTKYVHIKSTTVYAPRRNWDSPQPRTRRLVCPLPPVSGGRGTLAGEKGVGRVPIPTRGIHCGTLYMYVLCERKPRGRQYTVAQGRHIKKIIVSAWQRVVVPTRHPA